MANPTITSPLTIVLVHGAFADASGWNGVIERLHARGFQVVAPPNPLRGIAIDSAYIASFLKQIPGPVLAVGHSYGGAVITNAATTADNVVGLVYVAGFAPQEGERLADIAADSKDSVLNPFLVARQYPSVRAGQNGQEFSINPANFQEAFAADLPISETRLMAVTQRPIADLAFSDPTGVPAWKTRPAWAVVATGDKTIGTDAVRMMAKRSGAKITEVEGSHVIMISKPDVVTDVILSAVKELQSAEAVSTQRPRPAMETPGMKESRAQLQ